MADRMEALLLSTRTDSNLKLEAEYSELTIKMIRYMFLLLSQWRCPAGQLPTQRYLYWPWLNVAISWCCYRVQVSDTPLIMKTLALQNK